MHYICLLALNDKRFCLILLMSSAPLRICVEIVCNYLIACYDSQLPIYLLHLKALRCAAMPKAALYIQLFLVVRRGFAIKSIAVAMKMAFAFRELVFFSLSLFFHFQMEILLVIGNLFLVLLYKSFTF